MAEGFNVFNRANLRLAITDSGFVNVAGTFVPVDKTIGSNRFPAYYTTPAVVPHAHGRVYPRGGCNRP
jgi:hypothetical protein